MRHVGLPSVTPGSKHFKLRAPGRGGRTGQACCEYAGGPVSALGARASLPSIESKWIRRRARKGAGSSCVTPGLHAMGVHGSSEPSQ